MEILALGILFTIGALLTIAFGRAFQRSLATRDWPHVRGVIRESEMSTFGSPGEVHYQPIVLYSYEYCGERYEGRAISVIERSSQYPSEAREMQKQYQVGQEVDVYVDPASPNKAVLQAGPSIGSLVASLLGVVFMGAAVAIGQFI